MSAQSPATFDALTSIETITGALSDAAPDETMQKLAALFTSGDESDASLARIGLQRMPMTAL